MKTAAVAVSLLVALTAGAQVREQVTVELIEVPVYVTAPGGKPVRGLTKDAFELRIDGRRQTIDYFDAVDFAAPAPVVAQTATRAPVVVERRPARERRLYLLLFDLAYPKPAYVARAQKAAHFAVDQSNASTDLFSVATFTEHDGLQFVTSFLSDRAAIHRAIGTLSISDARDPVSIAMSANERADWIGAMNGIGGKRGGDNADMVQGGAAMQDMLQQPVFDRAEYLLTNMRVAADRLAGLEGQRHIVYLSTGFPACFIGFQPDPRCVRVFNELLDSARTSGVFVDTVDIGGIRNVWDTTTSATKVPETVQSGILAGTPLAVRQFAEASMTANEAMRTVALDTGGEYVHNRNDLGNALADLATEQQVVYILGFHRAAARSGEISVRVSGIPSGAHIAYRQGFGKAEKRTEVDALQLADILINDVPQNGVALAICADGSDVEIAIPVDEVRAQLVEETPYLDVLLYVFDEHGAAVEGMQKKIAIDDKLAPPLVVRKHLKLPPGRYVVKAITRIEGTASLGFARTDLDVE